MDVRLQNSQNRYTINGGAASPNARLADNSLHFLTPEEQDCIQFFENTIDSLEETLDDAPRRHVRDTVDSRPPLDEMDGPPHKDIIDLVRPDPELVLTRDHFSPDFQSLMPNPDSHFEIKPRRDPDGLPTDYNPPLPGGSSFTTDPHAYHPPGCIPTPVLIAQKIAENRGSSSTDPSSILHRMSLESEKAQSFGADPPVKHGPPTSAKPTRLPANISLVLNNRDYQTQSLANVNIQERRAQMLANLSGTTHPLLQENSQPAAENQTRNTPTRSISFRDPTPDKSRLEALSKLGLNRNRAMSGGSTLFDDPDGNPMKLPGSAEIGSKYLDVSSALPTEIPAPSLTQAQFERKSEILRSDSRRSYEERSPQPSLSPSSMPQTSHYPSSLDKPTIPPPPEVTSIEINSYGGKSIVVNPSVSSRNEAPVSPPIPEHRPMSSPTELNSFGGKSRVLPPPSLATSKSDLPDILSSHIDKSRPAATGPDPPSVDLNNYGGKTLNINPPAGFGDHNSDTPNRSSKAPPPILTPRPPRQSYQAEVTQQLAASRALSPDHKRKPSLFRPQSITVEFNGQGPTDESRKAALRKLGLLRDRCTGFP